MHETSERLELRVAVERFSSWIPEKQAGEPDLILPKEGAESLGSLSG